MCCTATILLLPPLLGGCSIISADPTDWWASLEGGAIAEQRPAPPGANDPFQPVEMIPPKPPPIDAASRQRIANGLASDQATAEAVQSVDPLTVKTQPNPGPPGAGPLVAHPAALPAAPDVPPSDPNAANASLQAADTPPPVPTPAPAAKPPAAVAAATTPAATNGPLPPIVPGPLPPIPSTPPALPAGLPEDFTIPGPPPDISQLQTPIVSGQSQPVTFRSGQAVVTPAAAAALKALVAARAGKMIRVIGRGEAASYDPAVQARALQLGLARADAIAAVLRGAGLPPSAMRVTVEPFGRGGAALLIS